MEVGKSTILTGFIGANNSTQFVIPTYQRNYVWQAKQVEELLNDIQHLFNSEKTHYLGTIVYINTVKKFTFQEETIIDGQQRLTTIFLILQALRYWCENNQKENEADIIIKKYLENDTSITKEINGESNRDDKYRLKPLIDDENIYEKIAKKEFNENNNTDSLLSKAFIRIKKRIEEWQKNYDTDTILKAIDRLKIVWIQIEKNEEPQRIFETINSTGVELTAADLIRNYILMNKENIIQTKYYENYWLVIEKNVTEKKLAEFFRFYISIQFGRTISDKDVYDSFKDYYEKAIKNDNEENTLERIKKYSYYYYYINNVYENSKKIEEALKNYRNITTNMPHILIMKSFELFENGKIIEQDLIDTINILSTYIVRRNIGGKDTKAISNIFGGVCDRIYREFKRGKYSYYNCVVKKLIYNNKQNSQVMPTDNDLKLAFLNDNMYSRGLCRYVLLKIENNNNDIPISNLSIEHVMPQTITSYWENMVDNLMNYDNIINHIGNLTLVSFKDNSGMKNKDFDHKKEYLSDTKHVKLNEYILEKEKWDEEEINKRSELLYNSFINIFKYPDINKFKDDEEEVNLIEDDINKIILVSPMELGINTSDDYCNNDQVNSWEDVFKKCIGEMYKINNEAFLNAINIAKEKDTSISNIIVNNPNGLTKPLEITDSLFVEMEIGDKEKIEILRKVYAGLDNDFDIIVWGNN